jgi:hypothetical protein
VQLPKIPCISKIPRAFAKNPVQLPKIPCICQKPRAIEKNPVHFVPYQVLLMFPGIVKSTPFLFSIQTHFYRILTKSIPHAPIFHRQAKSRTTLLIGILF